MRRIYLDANATTPLHPHVREAMLPWLDCGNASSPHLEGRVARDAIEGAREQVAALIGARPKEIVLTSGASESNALALLGSVRALTPCRALTTAVEHPSVLRTLEALRPNLDLEVAPVDADGMLRPDLDLPPNTELVSLMLVNNETGAILPVPEVAARAHASGAVVHTDAVQACGKLPVDVDALQVDLLSLSAHKMHGPKGAGALYVRRGTKVQPLFHGGEHERGLRAGTENVAAVVGLGAAAELARRELDERRARWERLFALLVEALPREIPDVRLNVPRRHGTFFWPWGFHELKRSAASASPCTLTPRKRMCASV
jgi:cysteine desulfurase